LEPPRAGMMATASFMQPSYLAMQRRCVGTKRIDTHVTHSHPPMLNEAV
jgi:hypothetical protein